MDEKDLYILKIAKFLYEHNKTMSLTELGEHLNRNFEACNYSETNGRGIGKMLSTLFTSRLPKITLEQSKDIGAEQSYLQTCILQIKSEDGSNSWEKY